MRPQCDSNPAAPAQKGFTLVEILIVVIILGILASVVFGGFRDSINQSRQGAFVTELHHYVTAAEFYTADTGFIVPDGSSGTAHPDFAPYIDENDFASPTPLGGAWDTEGTDSGFMAGLGVHFSDPSENPGVEVMTQVDAILDDGDLMTGAFRQAADTNRFYYAIVY